MLCLLLGLGLCHTANATVLFYRNALTVSVTGNARTMNRAFNGFTLIDNSNGDVAFISADVKSKRFKVEQPDHELSTVQSTKTGTRTILSIRSGAGIGLNARGPNVQLNDGSSQKALAPQAFVVAGCDASTPADTNTAYLFDYHGALVYDKTDTVAATQANATLATCIDTARQILISKGYTEN